MQKTYKIIQVLILIVITASIVFVVNYKQRSGVEGDSATTTIAVYTVGEIYPNPTVTPGSINPDVTQANISQNICNPKWSTKSIRPSSSYTTALKKHQLQLSSTTPSSQYGGYFYELGTSTVYSQNSLPLSDYEEDHLISLELGANPTDPANLWPEPYHASIPDGGAKNKDAVENYLHKQVCNSDITLAEAQREISTDWYVVYLTEIRGKLGAISEGIDQDDD